LTEENRSLKVELEEPTFQVGVMVVNLELVIELPEKEYENIELRTVSGDFQINGIRAVNLTTEVNSGDILLDGVILTSSYTSKVTSGDIHLEQVQGRTFGLTSVSGDMTFKALESETLTAETVSGDITIWDVPGDIILESSSGDITIENMEVQGNMDIEVLSGDVEVTFLDKPSSLDLDFKANSGAGKVYLKEMQFEKNEEDVIAGKIGSGEYTLKVRVASGDFKLN
jgi:lia operon protein LiaG